MICRDGGWHEPKQNCGLSNGEREISDHDSSIEVGGPTGSIHGLSVDLSIDETGGLRRRSGAQRFYERAIGFNFPMLFSGIADVREWYDDASRCFRISVDVRNSVWGPLFGYRGSFSVEWRRATATPAHIVPKRQECPP